MVKQRGIQFFNNIQDEYPYREELSSKFKKGDSTFENPFFAGTYNGQDQDTVENMPLDTAYSGILWTSAYSTNDIGRPDKGTEFLPRLLYWNKYSSNAGINQTQKYAVAQTWASDTQLIIASINYSSALSTVYPQATRLRTLSINLNTTDIVNLDFRKLVYIDGVYWRINKVLDYKPNNNESTKVELIEWFQLGTFAATAPAFGSSDFNWNPDGSTDVDLNWSL